MKKNKICFDIDGVICKTKKNNYKLSKPIIKNINKINSLYDEGYKIILYTARFMGRSLENERLATKKAKNVTLYQLKKWKVKFHSIKFGKPSFDLLVDDKCLFFKKNWNKHIKSLLK
tara:strand:- start:3414 stop:3764 length:351 start_codon:yes stop_codon:yes gene_type:complete